MWETCTYLWWLFLLVPPIYSPFLISNRTPLLELVIVIKTEDCIFQPLLQFGEHVSKFWPMHCNQYVQLVGNVLKGKGKTLPITFPLSVGWNGIITGKAPVAS